MNALILIAAISLLSGCTGYLARKSPEELAQTPDLKLCDHYFFITGSKYASDSNMAKKELQLIYAEFARREIPPEHVPFHCAHQMNP